MVSVFETLALAHAMLAIWNAGCGHTIIIDQNEHVGSAVFRLLVGPLIPRNLLATGRTPGVRYRKQSNASAWLWKRLAMMMPGMLRSGARCKIRVETDS